MLHTRLIFLPIGAVGKIKSIWWHPWNPRGSWPGTFKSYPLGRLGIACSPVAGSSFSALSILANWRSGLHAPSPAMGRCGATGGRLRGLETSQDVLFSSAYLIRRCRAFLSRRDASGSLEDRTGVGSWFPLGVTAGPGGSRAQAEPGRDNPGGWGPEGGGSREGCAWEGGWRSGAGVRASQSNPILPGAPRICSSGMPGEAEESGP